MNSERTIGEGPRGLGSLDEAGELLRGMAFSPGRGDRASGDRVTVQVDAAGCVGGRFDVSILCMDWGHVPVDWARLGLWAVGDGTVYRTIRLDDRGHAELVGLSPGSYRLEVGRVVDVRLKRPTGSEGYRSGLAAAPAEAAGVGPPDEDEFHSSDDGTLLVSVWHWGGDLFLKFESMDPAMAGRAVSFSFVGAADGRVVLGDRVEIGGPSELTGRPVGTRSWPGVDVSDLDLRLLYRLEEVTS